MPGAHDTVPFRILALPQRLFFCLLLTLSHAGTLIHRTSLPLPGFIPCHLQTNPATLPLPAKLKTALKLCSMEGAVIHENPRKRKLVASDDGDDDTGKVWRFKILLPNGTSVELTLRDPEPEMSFGYFISLVKNKYMAAPKHSESMKKKKRRDINWKGASLFLQDANDAKIRNVVKLKNYKPHKCHILRLHDGCSDIAKSFENMWDLTPDTDLLLELPEEYTFETALADLIDNSLQAVWSIKENRRRLISVNLVEDKISIFDNGPGMDDTDENSLVKWGKMGASLHRSSKSQAIGGKPPYLKPYFGMFGYGGPIASMHLGRHALVSSKTKHVKKVYMLLLEREALLKASSSELTWKTDGGIRDPSEDEIRDSDHGSFTKVEIYDPKVKDVNIYKLQCHLKDIYFPYIQCDDMSDKGKTITPIEFQVNDVDLTEIQGGEVAITNLHSCNGPEFVLQLHLFLASNHDGIKSPSSREFQEANARLRCVYFPFKEGKENIEKVLEKLMDDGCEIRENFQTFSRVSVRQLGRLLPDARWTLLPFMDLRSKKGNKAHLLRRCCLRVKCFIETDAGFKPTLSKTDLAHHNSFTTALKNFGNKVSDKEKGVVVEIHNAGKALTPLELEREYQEWILQMHDRYDEEADSGEDQPVIILGPANKKALGISSDVIRVHRVLKRKEKSWKRGQKIKVLKGACAGCHRTTIYATIEYFLLEGFEGDAGGEARIICRPIDIPDENGCALSVGDEDASLDVHGSLSLPLSVIDSGKLVVVESIEWDNRLNKKQQQSPATIDLLSSNHCRQLEVDGALPISAPVYAGQVPPIQIALPINSPVYAGQVPPIQAVAVVRPANFMPGATEKLDQKYICKKNIVMSMVVKFTNEGQNVQEVIHSDRVSPEFCKGFNGLYFFPLGCKLPNIFSRAGVYIFTFSLMESSCKSFEGKVIVKPSPCVGKWRHLTLGQSPPLDLRVGSCFPTLAIACYDIYDNRAPFQSIPEVTVKLQTAKGLLFEVHGMKIILSTDKLTLKIKDVLVGSNELDKIRPGYGATLVIASSDELLSLSIPCRVYPGFLKRVELQPQITENQILPGFIFKQIILEMFDAYGNHVSKGLEVTLAVAGFHILNHVGMIHKVDDIGRIDLSGLLKVTAGYGENASISVLFEDKTIFKQEFSTVRRNLRIASGVPDFCTAGGQLDNINFEIVNPDGDVDTNFHHNDKDGQFHMLSIKSDFFSVEESIRYTFKHGRCTIPSIPVPINDGTFCFEAAHSQYTELCLIVKVPVVKTPKVKNDVGQPPSPDKSIVHLQDSPSFNQEKNLTISFINNDKELERICRTGEKIGKMENYLNNLNEEKAETEREMWKLLEKVESYQLSNMNCLSTKDEMTTRIESMENSAAAVLCNLFTYQKPRKCFMEDIIGLVALLGTVQSPELSRILAEYLGEDKMLAVICRSFDAASCLERYKQSGEVDYECALHAEAAALGKAISKRFLVICLEDIRPYTGLFRGNDSQRKLALPDPILSNGRIPEGFMGYAVNMVDLDINHLQTRTASGHGLRETVLFSLFRKLHVYETRECMVAARACIEDGAVSMDGGILRENGILSLGYGNPFIYFPSENQMLLPPETGEIKIRIEEKKSELRIIEEDIGIITDVLEKYLKKFEKRKQRYNKLMDRMVPMIELLEYKPDTGDSSNMSDRVI